MHDLTVILDKKGITATLDSTTIRIDHPDRKFERIPINMIEKVIVLGSPMVSSGVWRALANRNIPVLLLPSRGYKETAWIGSLAAKPAAPKLRQYRARCDKTASLNIAKWLLSKKLRGQASVLRKFEDGAGEIDASCGKISGLAVELENADDINKIMGFEGAAAAEYFKTLAKVLPEKWNFSGRNRRPPKDPVNALLSLTYTLAGFEARAAIRAKGLDPALGFAHSLRDYRESLVLDILEPLRPEADKFVLRLIDGKLIVKNFTTTSEKYGCFLKKEGRRGYYYEWAKYTSEIEDDDNIKTIAKKIIDALVENFLDF